MLGVWVENETLDSASRSSADRNSCCLSLFGVKLGCCWLGGALGNSTHELNNTLHSLYKMWIPTTTSCPSVTLLCWYSLAVDRHRRWIKNGHAMLIQWIASKRWWKWEKKSSSPNSWKRTQLGWLVVGPLSTSVLLVAWDMIKVDVCLCILITQNNSCWLCGSTHPFHTWNCSCRVLTLTHALRDPHLQLLLKKNY